MADLWFEELSVGQVFKHAIRRTVTRAYNQHGILVASSKRTGLQRRMPA